VPDLVVAGAGMAGLVAAAQARAQGADVLVLEKGDRPGGSMRLSSGVVWRYSEFDRFRRECPTGVCVLQRLVHDRLDADLRWLEGLGARVLERSTGNPATVGVRFATDSLVDALTRAADGVRLQEPLRELPRATPVVLATGGFQADRGLLREHVTPQADALLLRATPWSSGDGLRLGLAAGGAVTAGLDEFYGRNMPAPPARVEEARFVELAQLYARHATVENIEGERFEARAWSEIDVVQWTARQPGARARYRVPVGALGTRVGRLSIGAMVHAAERAGGVVGRSDAEVTVDVVAGITTTLGGLAVDESARVVRGVYAAGSDAGGIATGGYASGLAAALVLGRVAASAALEGG
jgi:succinate dehydrogenase/fumarate reductase flavoprotein subunit